MAPRDRPESCAQKGGELREIEIERHVTIEHGRVLNNEFKM